MVNLRIVGKKFASRLPKKAMTELGELKDLERVGKKLVDAARDLIHAVKKGKQDRALKYGQRSHQAFQKLEELTTALDGSINTNAYEDGKKGREIKKDYKKAMAWYTAGGGRGGLLACLGKVKTSLQL